MVQWLRLRASTARRVGSIPVGETKILCALKHDRKKSFNFLTHWHIVRGEAVAPALLTPCISWVLPCPNMTATPSVTLQVEEGHHFLQSNVIPKAKKKKNKTVSLESIYSVEYTLHKISFVEKFCLKLVQLSLKICPRRKQSNSPILQQV